MRDAVSGGTLLVFGSALLFAIPYQVETLESDTLTPAFIPTAVTWIIVVLAAVLLARGIAGRRRNEGGDQPRPERWRQSLGVMGMVAGAAVLYVLAIPVLGYLLASGLALGAFSYLFGHRKWWQILTLMIVTPPALFLFFRYTMLVLLPGGDLFG
jgi:hypothetical protein